MHTLIKYHLMCNLMHHVTIFRTVISVVSVTLQFSSGCIHLLIYYNTMAVEKRLWQRSDYKPLIHSTSRDLNSFILHQVSVEMPLLSKSTPAILHGR